ncbi:MAG: hypothetical protein ACQKBW_10335, partial [Puniceicoccales bacterium]
ADRWQAISEDVTAGVIPYKKYWEVPRHSGGDFPWLVRSHYLGRNANLWAFKVALHTMSREWTHVCCRDILVDNIGFDGTGENCPEDAEAFASATMPAHRVDDMPDPETSPLIDAAVAAAHVVDEGNHCKRLRRRLSYYFMRLMGSGNA